MAVWFIRSKVMQIVRDLAGYSWGGSDNVRRAMAKKKLDVMEQNVRISYMVMRLTEYQAVLRMA